ncbi:hypothetical protein ASD13_02345 [Microbacterium sp. Root1433D1]|uniref:hypothetical protein n=1 Tax=unclassified Microbacterium TaxID=2609290 RepID=UPI0006F8A1F6|nr:hypothetical protein [Microbacterium sp. Root1433D1]KQY77539.1 hypothetical protein ASD13_02345 [Microbacterium sp. Root1433D1]
MTITEEQFTREHAEELCAFAIGPSGPDGIFILDLDGRAATEALSKNVATALATRLVELAAQLPSRHGSSAGRPMWTATYEHWTVRTAALPGGGTPHA